MRVSKEKLKNVFRYGPKNPFLRILWLIGLCVTKPFKHGEEFMRYKMYSDIAQVLRTNNVKGKVLSISRSEEICKYFTDVEIVEATYPEYNWLNLPFDNESFDCVISDMVIEHVEGLPQQAIAESLRILRKGGHLVLATNFIYPWHGGPVDYWRFTEEGLRYLCRDFSRIKGSGYAGNLSFIPLICLGLHKLPVPHCKYHPLHWLACKKSKRWAGVSWIVAQK